MMAEQDVLKIAADEGKRVDVLGPESRPADLLARRAGTQRDHQSNDGDRQADASGQEPARNPTARVSFGSMPPGGAHGVMMTSDESATAWPASCRSGPTIATRRHGQRTRRCRCVNGPCGRASAFVVLLALPRLARLAHQEDRDDQRRQRIGPPQPEHRVEREAGEGRR